MKILLISANASMQEQVIAAGAQHMPPLDVVSVRRPEDAARIMSGETVRLLLIDACQAEQSALANLEKLALQFPQSHLMLITADQSPHLLLQAMRAGVREVLSVPLVQAAFDQAVDRLLHRGEASVRNGRVVSFISCKGGSGATFLATNFAHAAATQANKKVLVIDLDRQFGDASLYLSEKKPTMTLATVCEQINRIDAAFLESSLVNVGDNLGVLAASDDPTHAVDVNPGHIETILRLARTYYDIVVLDIGRQTDAVTIMALDHSDLIFSVMQLSMPYLRDAGRLMSVFGSLGYEQDKARVIINRYDKGGPLKLTDVEKALGRTQLLTMPNNFKVVSESTNQGVPALELARHSPMSKSLVDLVENLVAPQRQKEPGLFGRLFAQRVQSGLANA